MHGRPKELVEGPWNRGLERWCAMVVLAMAALDAFVREDVCNAIAIVFTEEESNVVNGERKKKGSTKKLNWNDTLDCSNGLTPVPHKVLLEKVVYHQNRGGIVSLHLF
jgi:hypothetical protein